MKSGSTFPILVTVSFAGMAVFAVIDQGEAGKGITTSGSRTYSVSPIVRGGVSQPPTTGKVKANPPIVRDHRAGDKVLSPPQHCFKYLHPRGCIDAKKSIVRDHRQPGPRVVPKEDPPQKW